MIHKGTQIQIKDNSGVLSGICINTYTKCWAAIGDPLSITITKAKTRGHGKKTGSKSKGQIQELLVIQTKKRLNRLDGSSLKFGCNSGVCVSKGGGKSQLGFKRINTSVPFELKKRNPQVPVGNNLIKLAKNLV
jgi:ribosomal protein L14